jgi:hypothetical protein
MTNLYASVLQNTGIEKRVGGVGDGERFEKIEKGGKCDRMLRQAFRTCVL